MTHKNRSIKQISNSLPIRWILAFRTEISRNGSSRHDRTWVPISSELPDRMFRLSSDKLTPPIVATSLMSSSSLQVHRQRTKIFYNGYVHLSVHKHKLQKIRKNIPHIIYWMYVFVADCQQQGCMDEFFHCSLYLTYTCPSSLPLCCRSSFNIIYLFSISSCTSNSLALIN